MDAELGRLGLAERSVRLLTGRDIWGSITPLLAPRRNLVAAFGHVGPGAAALLPLEPGDTVITDASLDTVLSGATSPHALLHWVKAGVIVHSLRGLNAKLVIAEDEPSFVVVGSADVTAAGPRQLFEAVTVSHEKHTVEEAQEAWLEWCDLAGPALTASDLEPLLEQYGAGKLVTAQRPAAPTRATAPARPVVTSRPATPVRPAAATPPPSPVRPATPPPSPVRPAAPTPPPSPVRPAAPAPAAEVAPAPAPPVETPAPEPVAAPAAANEPEPGDTPEAAETTETQTDVPRPSWPRPAELYLVSLVEGGEPSAEAEYRLEELTREYTHPGENGEQPFRVELFWADDGQGQDPPRTLRAGVHVIRVYSQKQGRALVGSRIEAPGLVLQAYTDEFAYPRRTYCYILTRETAARPAFGELRKGLAAIGEKPNFRNSFQVPRKIEALLGLWPDLGYDPR
jgi:outer membrane biosynthesis protein TonB